MPIAITASNAVLAKARALYGKRLTQADYHTLAGCRSMTELADALRNYPLYADALEQSSSAVPRRAGIELDLRKSIFARYASLCRYEMSAGQEIYRYFILSCDMDEILTWLRYLDSGNPGQYLFVLPDFLDKHTGLDLYALARAKSIQDLLDVLQDTPYGAALAPLADADTEGSMLAKAEPLLMQMGHEALMRLIPKKAGVKGGQPGIRQYIERTCDIAALSQAARMKRIGMSPTAIRELLRLDCTDLTSREWDALLAAKDPQAFRVALDRTFYGKELARVESSYLQDGFQKIQYRWCCKWLRFSTDPTLTMLCYIFLAKNEVSNLNHIVEGVHYGMAAEEILSLLIGGDAS
ncbi:MAG: V-type ATPase subunit [Oscillospiraceae bacterium]|nr:V-type ATPase subunit [Oscillospiraceae bacterium]